MIHIEIDQAENGWLCQYNGRDPFIALSAANLLKYLEGLLLELEKPTNRDLIDEVTKKA